MIIFGFNKDAFDNKQDEHKTEAAYLQEWRQQVCKWITSHSELNSNHVCLSAHLSCNTGRHISSWVSEVIGNVRRQVTSCSNARCRMCEVAIISQAAGCQNASIAFTVRSTYWMFTAGSSLVSHVSLGGGANDLDRWKICPMGMPQLWTDICSQDNLQIIVPFRKKC
jgi:hypothetical protein